MKPAMCAQLGVVAALFSASASQAEDRPTRPPYEGVYQPQGVDEIGFWREDDESERALSNSPLVIRDEDLNNYLKGVLCDAIGPDRCGSVRIYVIREPTFNATMSPNGTMRIYSGLLLRMRSEAELAAVLGHEFGHFEMRHTLNRFKAARSGTDLMSWAGLLAGMAPGYGSRGAYSNMQLSVFGNFYSFKRDQEREADRLGVAYLNDSGLRPQAASEVWLSQIAEYEASAKMKGLKKPRFDRIAFTASHPPEGERALTLANLALPEGATRDDGKDSYRIAMAKWMPEFLNDQIQLNDFGASEYVIDSLAENGWTADLWLARAELFRLRGNQRDFINSVSFYQEAIALQPGMADAYRGLGLSLMKTGQRSEGGAALAQYLVLKPDASDAKMIQMVIPKEEIE